MIVAVISVNFYIFLFIFFFLFTQKYICIAGLQRDLNPLLLRFLALQCSII